MGRETIAFALLASVLLAAPVAAQESPDVRVSIGGRVQTQFNTTDVEGEAPSELAIRRARIELAVKVGDRITGTIAPDFAGDRVSLKDAYLNYEVSPGFQLRAGRMHRPFGLIEQTSSKRILPIERGLRIRGIDAVDEYAILADLGYSDRDVGLMLHGAPDGADWLSWAAGVFRGPLHGDVGDRDSYQVAARATAAVLPRLRVGAGWSNRQFADSVAGTQRLARGSAFEVDLEYGSFAPGLHVIAEASTGDADPFSDDRFTGGQVWLAYRTEPVGSRIHALEPVLRLSHVETDFAPGHPLSGGTLVTPGLNLYLSPLTRLMLNYDIWRGEDDIDASGLKAMFQIAF